MRTNLEQMRKAAELLQEIYYKATVNHLSIFLYIASRGDEVIETRDLPDALGMKQTTINRSIRSMADRSYIHEVGFGLLRQSVNMTDERQRIVELTPKGKMLAKQMEELLNGE